MREFHNRLNSYKKRKTLRDTSLRCVTNKFGSKKKRLCLKCGEKFLNEGLYNRIYEKCSLINEKVAMKTYSEVQNLLVKKIFSPSTQA